MESNKKGINDEKTGGGGEKDAESGKVQQTNRLIRLIQAHYSVVAPERSKAAIESEKFLIGNLKFSRWFLLPAAVVIQFCCGSLYAWSVLNKPIDNLIYGHNEGMAPIAFYIAVGLLGSSAALMGPWLERRGPRVAALTGTCLFFLGNLVTALALYLKIIWLVYIGYGLICGFAIGLCYISPVSALQKWFPDKRGLASGFAVCGFGAGSIAIAKVQIPLINEVGLPLMFVILGSCYFTLMVLSALVLRIPPPDFSVHGMTSDQKRVTDEGEVIEEEKKEISLIEAITSRDFRLMYIMFFANVIFGLVVISRLSNMVQDIFTRTAEEAATVVSINGGLNLGGRLIFSIASDFVGRKNCYFIMLSLQVVILAIFSTITDHKVYPAFLAVMWILSACYGAGFGVIPAFLTDKFGPKNIGACHGIMLTGWSSAGVIGGLVFTEVFNKVKKGLEVDDPFPYNVNSWWILVVVCIGWMALLFVKQTEKDRNFIKAPIKLGRSILHRRTFVVSPKV